MIEPTYEELVEALENVAISEEDQYAMYCEYYMKQLEPTRWCRSQCPYSYGIYHDGCSLHDARNLLGKVDK
jgi:hypothetical protein